MQKASPHFLDCLNVERPGPVGEGSVALFKRHDGALGRVERRGVDQRLRVAGCRTRHGDGGRSAGMLNRKMFSFKI
jgi:hypothetical protein